MRLGHTVSRPRSDEMAGSCPTMTERPRFPQLPLSSQFVKTYLGSALGALTQMGTRKATKARSESAKIAFCAWGIILEPKTLESVVVIETAMTKSVPCHC